MKNVFYALGLSLLLMGCDEDKNRPEPVNEEELITTVKLNFIPQDGGDTLVFSSTDLDGDGAQPPVVVNDTLAANTVYEVYASFLNELEQPAEDITVEIVEEGTDHQIFFLIEPELNLEFTYQDKDAYQYPIGVHSTFISKEASQGKLNLILRHLPNKSAEGVANGDITNAGGETDVEVSFEINIQ